MKRSKDEVGNTYGSLTVVSFSHQEEKTYKIFWNCKCACGNTAVVNGSSLRMLRTRTCGCGMGVGRQVDPITLYRRGFNSLKAGAKDRGLEVTITFDDYQVLVDSICYFCGTKPQDKRYLYSRKRYSRGIEHDFWLALNGVDRLDSSKGYTLDNCVTSCTMCNRMKSDFDADLFMEKIEQIYRRKYGEGTSQSSTD